MATMERWIGAHTHQKNKTKQKQNKTKQKQKQKYVKEPSPIVSAFCQTFWDFGIRRNLIYFVLPLANFTAEKSTDVWEIWKYD